MGRANPAARALAALALALAACGPTDERADQERADAEGSALAELPADVRGELEALGYVITTELAGGPGGVTVNDRQRAQAGWNLYVSMHGREAFLIDMDGRELYRWKGPPRPKRADRAGKLGLWWRTVRLLPNGDLLAQTDYGPLMRLDAESRPLWIYDDTCHHDFDVASDGRIFAIAGNDPIRHRRFAEPLSEDFVVELDPNGVERARVSLLAALVKGRQREALAELRAAQLSAEGIARRDVTHLNAVEILGATPAGAPGAFAPGRLLLSTPKNHRVLLMDFASGEIVWSLRGSFRYQHDPTFTRDGRLLLFDNQRERGERSRVLALDPASGEERWSWGEPPDPPFFSQCCGRVHPLANGNLLVVVSGEGRAVEIDPERRIVWEFHNPHELGGKTAMLNDVLRIDPADLDPDFVARVQAR